MRLQRGLMFGAMLLASLVGGAVSNLVFTAGVGAQAPADVVTATQVNIVDGSGRLRAVLSGTDETGRASLAFYGPDGDRRGFLGVDPDGTPHLRLNDPAGDTRLAATLTGSDPSITMGDQNGRNLLLGAIGDAPLVGLSHAGQARLQLALGEAGQPNLSLQGQPSVDLMGAPGQRGIGLSVDADGAPFLSLFDVTGAQRVAVGAVQGTTVVNLGDGTRPRLVLGVAPDGEGSIAYFDTAGEMVRFEGANSSQ